jgi:hypothetical protein
MTSAVNASEESDVAVKHVPLTAMESPRDKPATDSGALIVKIAELSPRSMDEIVPSSVISPVNI